MIPSSQKFKEEMYFFFSEFNKTARLDEEPYRARIGRVCTVRAASPFLHLTRGHQVAAFTLANRSWCPPGVFRSTEVALQACWPTRGPPS